MKSSLFLEKNQLKIVLGVNNLADLKLDPKALLWALIWTFLLWQGLAGA